MSLRPRSYSGELITSIVSREAPSERNVRARTNSFNNMYRKTYAKTKSSYGRKKPISQSRAVATAKRHNFKVNVERVIRRQVEVKHVMTTVQSQVVTSYNQSIGSVMALNTCIPYNSLTQGTGQSNRIGNRIRTRKLTMSFAMCANPYNATTNTLPKPYEVVMMFGVVKNAKPITPVSSDFQKLYTDNNSFRAPTSTLLDWTAEVNTDWWTIRKVVRFKIGNANYGGTASNANAQSFSNNDFKLNVVRKLDLTSISPSVLKFNDTTLQPTNDGLFMWCYAVPADGSVGTDIAPIKMDYTIGYYFEDA